MTQFCPTTVSRQTADTIRDPYTEKILERGAKPNETKPYGQICTTRKPSRKATQTTCTQVHVRLDPNKGTLVKQIHLEALQPTFEVMNALIRRPWQIFPGKTGQWRPEVQIKVHQHITRNFNREEELLSEVQIYNRLWPGAGVVFGIAHRGYDF